MSKKNFDSKEISKLRAAAYQKLRDGSSESTKAPAAEATPTDSSPKAESCSGSSSSGSASDPPTSSG